MVVLGWFSFGWPSGSQYAWSSASPFRLMGCFRFAWLSGSQHAWSSASPSRLNYFVAFCLFIPAFWMIYPLSPHKKNYKNNLLQQEFYLFPRRKVVVKNLLYSLPPILDYFYHYLFPKLIAMGNGHKFELGIWNSQRRKQNKSTGKITFRISLFPQENNQLKIIAIIAWKRHTNGIS